MQMLREMPGRESKLDMRSACCLSNATTLKSHPRHRQVSAAAAAAASAAAAAGPVALWPVFFHTSPCTAAAQLLALSAAASGKR